VESRKENDEMSDDTKDKEATARAIVLANRMVKVSIESQADLNAAALAVLG
jgi:hypothetical protein